MSGLADVQVLVTGAGGFIGSHLTERLVGEDARVRALCEYNSDGRHGWLDELGAETRDAIDLRLGDVRDAGLVEQAMTGVEVVFHLAALIAIPYSYEAPRAFLHTNAEGTLNVLEAARRTLPRRVIHTSTSEVYGTPETTPIRESHPLRGQSPYSASKIAADKLCEAYAFSFGVPVVVLRPFNTFGPRQSARAVIPTILGQLLAGARSVRLGSLHPRRDFTYVDDTVDGFVRMAAADLAPGDTVNLGTGETISVADLFDACRRVTGSEATVVQDEQRVRPPGSEVEVLVSDPSRAAQVMGWRATTGFEEGLRRTAEWLGGRTDAARAAVYHR
jgi:UDP-glucose 4-epimerase